MELTFRLRRYLELYQCYLLRSYFFHNAFYIFGNAFQVFADHESSLHPLQVPRSLIWSLRRRFVYFGTSLPNIVKGAYD